MWPMLCCAHLEVLFHENSHIIHVWGWLVHYAPSSILIRQTLCCSHLCVCSGYFVFSLIHTPGTSVEGKLAKKRNAVLSSKIHCKRPPPPFFFFNCETVRKRIHVWKKHFNQWMAVVKQGMSLVATFSTSGLVFVRTTRPAVILFPK